MPKGEKTQKKPVVAKGTVGFLYGGIFKTGHVRLFSLDDENHEEYWLEQRNNYGKDVQCKYFVVTDWNESLERVKREVEEDLDYGDIYNCFTANLTTTFKTVTGVPAHAYKSGKGDGDEKEVKESKEGKEGKVAEKKTGGKKSNADAKPTTADAKGKKPATGGGKGKKVPDPEPEPESESEDGGEDENDEVGGDDEDAQSGSDAEDGSDVDEDDEPPKEPTPVKGKKGTGKGKETVAKAEPAKKPAKEPAKASAGGKTQKR